MSQQPVDRERSHHTAASRSTRVRVRYADTDRMGVVYYANYLVWFEVGRTEWFRDTGWSYCEMEGGGVSLPVIEAHCEYRQPARYDDELEIRTSGCLLTPVRIRFDYEVLRRGEDRPLAIGHTIHASLNRTGRPQRLPAAVREATGLRNKTRPAAEGRPGHRRPLNRPRRLE